MSRGQRPFKIVAPVSSAGEAEALIAAGANELYCGHLPDAWRDLFGDADWANRRQGGVANVRSARDLGALVDAAGRHDVPVSLTLNARYSRVQEPQVERLASQWEAMGGSSVVTADISLLSRLASTGSRLWRHLSVLGAVFNGEAALFWQELGIQRIVSPRSVEPAEVGDMARRAPGMQWEVIAMHQRCPFVDGLCGFYHGTRYPSRTPCAFEYEARPDRSVPVVRSHDPEYEGHGCGVEFSTDGGRRFRLSTQDADGPSCGLCTLPAFLDAGVGAFKIAGRGFPLEMLVQAVTMLDQARRRLRAGRDGWEQTARGLYEEHTGRRCSDAHCYTQQDPWRGA